MRDGKLVYDTYLLHGMSTYIRERLEVGSTGFLMPVINQPSIEVGKYQNVMQEVNLPLIEEKGIQLLRRRAGGGTIYYDKGCLALWFKMPDNGEGQDHFTQVLEPVISVLKELGVSDVKRTGRNDLTINDKKVSGTAIFTKDGYLGGGVSLLLDIDFDTIDAVLTPNIKKLESKGIKSTRSRVTELRPYLFSMYQDLTTEEFTDLFLMQLYETMDVESIPQYELTSKDWEIIDKEYLPLYQDWDWNYGENPKFEYQRDAHLNIGTIEFNLKIEKHRIVACKIYGDFFSRREIKEVEEALIGTKLTRTDLLTVLEKLDLSAYFGEVSSDTLVDVILG